METIVQEHLIVSELEAKTRLDKWLSLKFPSYSRTYFQTLIEEGSVLINGLSCKKRITPSAGDEIEVCFTLTPELSLEPENIPLDILYEDADLLVINKRAGMVIHPAPGHPHGTFVNALLFHCQSVSKEMPDPLRPGIVHRLDKDTSGVLVSAKTSYAHRHLVEAFSKRAVKKIYRAICLGVPSTSRIDAPLARHSTKRQEMTVCEKGKAATTILSIVDRGPKTSSLSIELITGRTHQIRVHLKHIGCPILGDPVYGRTSINAQYGACRQLLHAETLSLPHPRTGKILSWTAPIPADMQTFLENLP